MGWAMPSFLSPGAGRRLAAAAILIGAFVATAIALLAQSGGAVSRAAAGAAVLALCLFAVTGFRVVRTVDGTVRRLTAAASRILVDIAAQIGGQMKAANALV